MDILPFQTISDNVILDRWNALVHGGQGHAEEVYQDAQNFLQEVQLPDLVVGHRILATSFLSGLLGNQRDFLAISLTSVHGVVVYLGAYDLGTSLSCHWYFVSRVGILQTLLEKAPSVLSGKEPPQTLTPRLNLFAKDVVVRHLASATHTALAQAVERLMEQLGEDPARLDTRTGFQGIQ